MNEAALLAHLIGRHGESADLLDWWRSADRDGRTLACFHEFCHRHDHVLDHRGDDFDPRR